MRKLLLKICYDGTSFCGWQIQPNGITVQQVLCDALSDLLSAKTDVTGCSRTDSGVHANEFYCHFTTENDTIDNKGFIGALNARLPKTVSVFDCFEVPLDFHARYSAKEKQYIYKFYLSDVRNPFLDKYALRVYNRLSLEKISQFCKILEGTHDFAAFSSTGREYDSTVRTISECKIDFSDGIYTLSVKGDGFLYNMVRIIVGTALFVSEGKISLDTIKDVFDSKDRRSLGPTAPPHALFLNKVFYDEGAF